MHTPGITVFKLIGAGAFGTAAKTILPSFQMTGGVIFTGSSVYVGPGRIVTELPLPLVVRRGAVGARGGG